MDNARWNFRNRIIKSNQNQMLRLNFNLLKMEKMENERKYYTIDQYGNEVRPMTEEEVTQHLYEMQARIDEEWHISLGG